MPIHIGVDGGARANGKPHCVASYAFCITHSECAPITYVHEEYGIIPRDVTPTNNRGEMYAILNALCAVHDMASEISLDGLEFVIVSDSEYCIKTITEWYPKWCREGSLAERKNVDLIEQINQHFAAIIELGAKIEFKHTRGHKDAPAEGHELYWHINAHVDKLTQIPL
jgi:ribonuclease HI